MAKASPLQGDFSGGEIGPLFYGRANTDRYKSSLGTCLNYIPTIQGGITRRPGTEHVSPTLFGNTKVRLIPFEISRTESYAIEIGLKGGFTYLRQYRDRSTAVNSVGVISAITKTNPGVVTVTGHNYVTGREVILQSIVGMTELNGRRFRVGATTANTFQILNLDGTNFDTTSLTTYVSGGTASRIHELYYGVSEFLPDYTDSELAEIQYCQSDRILYLVHRNHQPLLVTIDSSGFVQASRFTDFSALPNVPLDSKGPMVDGSASTSMAPAAISGSNINIVASGPIFQASDVGRVIGVKQAGVWGYIQTTAYTNATTMIGNIVANFANTTASFLWEWSAWSATTGYPATVSFHENRLWFGGSKSQPLRIDGSRTGSYKDFTPHGTAADDPVSFTLNSKTRDAVRWLATDEKGLLAGTSGGEWIIRATTLQEAISATNAVAKKSTGWGSSEQQAVQVGKAVLYMQSSGRKVRELTYQYDVEGFKSEEVSVLANHITGTGVTQLCHQKEPQSIIWGVRADGMLLGMTYDRSLDSLKVGWSRHQIGGESDAAGTQAIVESICVMPSADGSRDELWMVVRRYIGEKTYRFIEVMSKMLQEEDPQRNAKHVDSSLTYDLPLTVTGISRTNPVVITSTAHGFTNGQKAMVTDAIGCSEVNGFRYTVQNVTANTFELVGVDGTGFKKPYVGSGQLRKFITTVSGLWHLEGQTVNVCTDGAEHPAVTVSNGQITLSTAACTVHVGYAYNSDGQMLRLDAGAADGTAIGKTRRTHRVGFMFHRTLGFKFGVNFTKMDTITFRTANNAMTTAVPLFSGIMSVELDADYDMENQISWRQSGVLPGTILAVMPQMQEQDR